MLIASINMINSSASTQSNPSLSGLCRSLAVLAVGMGMLMMPTGLFVGPHILLVAAVLIATGTVYWIAASGIRVGKLSAFRLAAVCSAILAIVGLFAVNRSLSRLDSPNVTFWTCFAAYFACLGIVSLRGSRNRVTNQAQESESTVNRA